MLALKGIISSIFQFSAYRKIDDAEPEAVEMQSSVAKGEIASA